jgi:hypothetical protein
MSRPGKMSIKSGDGLKSDPAKTKKARFICLERSAIVGSQRARIKQSGLGALAVIFNAPCKLTSKSAQR